MHKVKFLFFESHVYNVQSFSGEFIDNLEYLEQCGESDREKQVPLFSYETANKKLNLHIAIAKIEKNSEKLRNYFL